MFPSRALPRAVALLLVLSMVVYGFPRVSSQVDEPEPPDPPSRLAQLKSDGVTQIPLGGTITDNAVKFRALIGHPAGTSVQLHVQVALVGDDDFILPVQSVITPLGGGGVATGSVTLDPNPYHWRCRTIDKLGNTSSWVEFGGNAESRADFSVKPADTATEITLTYSVSPGSSLISVPLATRSTTPSEVFQGLPANAVVQEWDAVDQRYLDASETSIAVGKAYRIDLFSAAELKVTGARNVASDTYIDLEPGWNLVGTPFEVNVPWAGAQVVREGEPVTLDDAISDGWLEERIYSWDASGRATLSSGDRFKALQGYTFYANEPGLRLKFSRPPLLQGVAEGAFKDLAKGLVKGALKYIAGGKDSQMGQLLEMIGAVDYTKERLIEISDKLDTVIASQKRIESKLADLAQQLAISTNELKKYTEESVNILPVITALKTHYDNKGSATISLGYYYEKSKNLDDLSTVDKTGLDQFASDVLRTWNFVDNFNSINTAIMSPLLGHDGVLDAWAQDIILKDTNKSHALMTHYKAMEAYFAQLLGLQLKCAHVIVEAYQRLGNKSGSGYSPTDADTFMTKTYKPAIDEEIEAFLKTVEYIAVAKADWTKTRTWTCNGCTPFPGRFLTEDAREMLARADFFAAQWRGEDTNYLTGRVITSGNVIHWSNSLNLQSPTSQSVSLGTLRTIDGPDLYPSWYAVDSKSLNEFVLSKKWFLRRFTLTSTSPTTYTFQVPAWINLGTYQTATVTTQKYDNEYNPSSSGANLFGSITFDIRASSPEVLNPTGLPSFGWDSLIKKNRSGTGPPSGGKIALPDTPSIYYGGKGIIYPSEYVDVWRPIKYTGDKEATATVAASYDLSKSYLTCDRGTIGSPKINLLSAETLLYVYDTDGTTVGSFNRKADYLQCYLYRVNENPSFSFDMTLKPNHTYYFGLRLTIGGTMDGDSSKSTVGLIGKFKSMSMTNVAFK